MTTERAAADKSTAAVVNFAALNARVADLHRDYSSADPWPHVTVHDMFPDDLLRTVKQECMRVPETKMSQMESRAQIKEETPDMVGAATASVFEVLESEEFVRFLEQVTDVDELICDPTHAYAGIHRTPHGGYTLVHRDFRRHPVNNLYHRVNVLLYLNQGWKPEFGGQLELWPNDMSGKRKVIEPIANTLVVWETHDQTLHGLPTPVACAAGDARVALASYYYTRAPRTNPVKRRGPVYVRRTQDSWLVGRRNPMQVLRALRQGDRAF